MFSEDHIPEETYLKESDMVELFHDGTQEHEPINVLEEDNKAEMETDFSTPQNL